MRRLLHRVFPLTVLGLSVLPAHAANMAGEETSVKFRGALSLGTTLAIDSGNPEVMNRANAVAVGTVGFTNGGRNSDDSRYNFRKGETVSSVLKGFVEADITRGNLGLLLQAKVWDDFGLGGNSVRWGNFPNRYVANTPLSDQGFSERASFSGAVMQEAYAYGSFSAGDMPAKIKLGQQLIGWGLPTRTGGALAEINPADAPAAQRAGAFAEETRAPFAALFGQLGLSKDVRAEGFYQFDFVPNEIPGCGTYFSPNDFGAQGCNIAWVQTANVTQTNSSERVLLPTGGPFITRSPDHKPDNSGQYGLGLTYKAASLGTDFGLYYSSLHSRRQVPSVSKTLNPNAATPFVSGSALNPHYYIEWPERVKSLALNFTTRKPDLTVSGELSYRPNDIFRLNGSDQLAAANNPTAATPLRADVNALALGADWAGYERHEHVQFSVAAEKGFPAIMGAQRVTLSGEVGVKYVPDLPDVTLRRYGRPDVFGIGPVNGVCPATATVKACSNDGYVTKTSWGYRARAAWLYANVIDGLDLRAALSLSRDVSGNSTDGVFIDGRQVVGLELRADYRKRYFAEVQWMVNSGGDYSMTMDKSYLNLSAGVRF